MAIRHSIHASKHITLDLPAFQTGAFWPAQVNFTGGTPGTRQLEHVIFR